MSEEVGKKTKIRGGHRAHVQKLAKKAKELCQMIAEQDHGDGNTRAEIEVSLQALKKSLSDKLKTLEELDIKILDVIEDEDEIENEIEEAGDFKNNLHETIVEIELTLNKLNTNVEKPMGASGHESDSLLEISATTSSSVNQPSIRLPKIELKHFTGDPIKFQGFWDTFKTTIHENKSVPAVNKMTYLLGLLEGPAHDAVAGLTLSESNYQVAVSLLQERFGTQEVIIAAHMDALLKLDNVNTVDVMKLRAVYDNVERHVRGLETLGIDNKQYGKLLVPILMSKIPTDLQLIITRKLGKDKWDLEALLKSFKEEIEAREMCLFVNASAAKENKKNLVSKKDQFTSLQTLFSGQTDLKKSVKNCSFCGQQHVSSKCSIVTNVHARKTVLKQKGMCFMCLRQGHISKNCPSKFNFKCFTCGGLHNSAICYKGNSGQNNVIPKPQQNPTQSRNQTEAATTSMCVNTNTSVLLQTAQAYVSNPTNPQQKIKARIIFDSCSQRSYVSHKLHKALNLNSIGCDRLLIKAFGEETPKLKSSELVQLSITSIDGMELYVNAYSVPIICSPLSNQATNVAVERYPHLQGIELADLSTGSSEIEIDVLIGADYYWNFVSSIVRRGETAGPIALYTKLGWVLSGPVVTECQNKPGCAVNLTSTHVLRVDTVAFEPKESPDNLHDLLSKFWDLETLGIRQDEMSVYDKFTQEVKFNGERYEAKLPFKEEHPMLPDNYALCVKRLSSTLRRLRAKPEVLQEYDRIISEQEKSGIVQKVQVEKPTIPGTVHYLPHREVIRMDRETTKLRVVYDASAKSNKGEDPSLNDCLYAGPALTPLIFDILLRFRTNKVAVTADIEKAFLNISIAPEHRDYLRFLWIKDPQSETPEMQVLRFARVVFGVTSSPFILNATIRHHVNQYNEKDPEFVKEVLQSLYVDDYVSSSCSEKETYELCSKLKSRLAEGGFNMRKWLSNSKQLVNQLKGLIKSECESSEVTVQSSETRNQATKLSESAEATPAVSVTTEVIEEDLGYSQSVFSQNCDTNSKVLGQEWDFESDKLIFNLSNIISAVETEFVTKRSVLSLSARFYDPLGLISPIVLKFKQLFQEVCKRTFKWNDPLDEAYCHRWKLLINSLREISSISIDRCYLSKRNYHDVKSVQIHAFGDASEISYGSSVYLRLEYESDSYSVLLASKTRVAPQKKQTIPRLELLACLLTAKLSQSVKNALDSVIKIDSTIYWSDSMVALAWIRNTAGEFKQFIQNRVSQIRKLASVEFWRYCPTKSNPADIASRGALASELVDNEQWWYGPSFLRRLEEEWPRQVPDCAVTRDQVEEEMRSSTAPTATTLNITAVSGESKLECVIQASRYSSLVTLLRVTAYVLRFVHNLKQRTKSNFKSGELTTVEVKNAEKMWIKHVQTQVRSSEKFNKMKLSLNLFTDEEGILRSQGRIGESKLPYDSKYPIVIPADHYFTKLVIISCHGDVLHNGVQETLCQVRSRFWIVKGRQVVKRVLSSCTVCRKQEGRTYGSPASPNLPAFRVTDDFAFTNIGIDYAGPLYVKDIYSQTGEMNKVYIALYTCASSRAVHLDLAIDATSNAFIRSFKRFIGRRGYPTSVLSDNAKTFKSAELNGFLSSKGIKWMYNVDRAPWWGGFFERMVRSVKRCLKKTLANARLNYEELQTVLVQIEGVLNSRPLTYLCEDGGEPLTPSHLVTGRRLLTLPGESKNNDMGSNEGQAELSRREKYLRTVLSHYWTRWRRDYLTQLRERHRPAHNRGPIISVGDVVSIHEDKATRLNWSVGKVERLLTGRDGKVRAAVVRTHDKKGRLIELKRPLQRLFPIELNPVKKNVPISFVREAEQENSRV